MEKSLISCQRIKNYFTLTKQNLILESFAIITVNMHANKTKQNKSEKENERDEYIIDYSWGRIMG